jgi:hypothetical protein
MDSSSLLLEAKAYLLSMSLTFQVSPSLLSEEADEAFKVLLDLSSLVSSPSSLLSPIQVSPFSLFVSTLSQSPSHVSQAISHTCLSTFLAQLYSV